MTPLQMIERFGGRDEVARLTGAKPNAVRAWARIGVPYKFFDLLVVEARKRGIRGVSTSALYAGKPRQSRETT